MGIVLQDVYRKQLVKVDKMMPAKIAYSEMIMSNEILDKNVHLIT